LGKVDDVIATAEASRSEVVRTVRLALHGPDGPSGETWPGFDGNPQVLTRDAEMPPSFSRNLPMISDGGNDLISVPPTILYGVGILYPSMTIEEISGLIMDQAENGDAGDVGDAIKHSMAAELEGSDDDDDESGNNSDSRQLGQSLALSFHGPMSEKFLQVEFSGATYRPFSVQGERGPIKLYERITFSVSKTLDETKESQSFSANGVEVNLGVRVTPTEEGNKIFTVWVSNETTNTGEISEVSIFQTKLTVKVAQLLPYPEPTRALSESEESLSLLYRDVKVYAVGHSCDARTTRVEGGWIIESDVLPEQVVQTPDPDIGKEYEVGMLDLGLWLECATGGCEKIIVDYSSWTADVRLQSEDIGERHSRVATRHADSAAAFLADVEEGWALAKENADVQQVLKWTSVAMNAQRRATQVQEARTGIFSPDSERIEGMNQASPHPFPDFESASPTFGFGAMEGKNQGFWRPFQLGFLLSQLPKVVNRHHARRDEVDVIWMPTGGGKTEAYLALAAFAILWERREAIRAGAKISYHSTVLMRYTLTLLTSQQVARAASMICALEILRQSNEKELGTLKFRIGAWLGGGTTPNTNEQAKKWYNDILSKKDQRFLLSKCPWCSCEMGAAKGKKIAGYRIDGGLVVILCPDPTCPFSKEKNSAFTRLPVLQTDDDIYTNPPSFIVGTVDKFAQLSWNPESGRILGFPNKESANAVRSPPPSLLIQDELHLISGALGTLDALYEIALEKLCESEDGVKPIIVAATATTKGFETQIVRLYGREKSRLLPPPGLSIEDSFFSRVRKDVPGKIYLAVCATGLGSVLESQLRSIAAVAQAAPALENSGSPYADAWWTNLVFFGSKRSIGQLQSYAELNLNARIRQLAFLSGVRTGRVNKKGERAPGRSVEEIPELTATSRFDSKELMDKLAVPKQHKNSLDLCFATSMIEVGLDISRLGMMTVMGQPKNNSQYIQATGRVGRSSDAPGLILVVLNPYSARDRSHFESFKVSHQRLYSSVEPASVTPFTTQALQRGLAGALAAVIRHTSNLKPGEFLAGELGQALISFFTERAESAGGERAKALLGVEIQRLKQLASLSEMGDSQSPDLSKLMVKAETGVSQEVKSTKWVVPNSLRSVEGESGVKIPMGGSGPKRDGPGKGAAPEARDLG